MVPSEWVLPCMFDFYLGISLECMLYFINCEIFFNKFLKISKSVDQSLKLLCITIGINGA